MSISHPSPSCNSTFDICSHDRTGIPLDLFEEASWQRYDRRHAHDVMVMQCLTRARARFHEPNWTDADWAAKLKLRPEYFSRVVARVRQENLMENDSYQLRMARTIEKPDKERLERLLWFTLEGEVWRRYGVERPRDVLEIRHLILAQARLDAPHWTDADWAQELGLQAAHFRRILARARERGLMAADSYELLGVENPQSSAPPPPSRDRGARSDGSEPAPYGSRDQSHGSLVDPVAGSPLPSPPSSPPPSPSTLRVRALRKRRQSVSSPLHETHVTPNETPDETHVTPNETFQGVTCNGPDIDIESNRIDSIDIDINKNRIESNRSIDVNAADVAAAISRASLGSIKPARAQALVRQYGVNRCLDVVESLPHWHAGKPAAIMETALKAGPLKYPVAAGVLNERAFRESKARQETSEARSSGSSAPRRSEATRPGSSGRSDTCAGARPAEPDLLSAQTSSARSYREFLARLPAARQEAIEAEAKQSLSPYLSSKLRSAEEAGQPVPQMVAAAIEEARRRIVDAIMQGTSSGGS